MKKILFGIVLSMIIPCQSWSACNFDDQRCYVMTNDYNGTIYMARAMMGEWSPPIKVFEDKERMNFVLRPDLLTNIFYTTYLKDGRYGVYMYSMVKDGKSLNELSIFVREFLRKNPNYYIGGNLEKIRFVISTVRYDMEKKIVYSGGRWGAMILDSYGKLIVMIPIPRDQEGQPFSENSEKIGKGIIAAFDREVKIAKEKGQIPESLDRERDIVTSSSNQGYTTYRNSEFGYQIDYPQVFVRLQSRKANKEVTFHSPDNKAFLALIGGENRGTTINECYDDNIKGTVKDKEKIISQTIKDNWFSIKWMWKNDMDNTGYISHLKMFVGNPKGASNGFMFSYPEQEKDKYEKMVMDIEKSFIPGDIDRAR